MQLTIHRGTNEIGGSCVEVTADNATVLIDAGKPLRDEDCNLPRSEGIDAVFVSHPHQDHFGLIDQLSDEVPVYIGRLGQKLIQATRLFLGQEKLKNKFENMKAWQPVKIGDGLSVTPYPVDHSAADAYGFLIEAGNKRIFYSGDFRAHGRKQRLFEHILKRPPCDVDALLLEGTMLDRSNSEFPDEKVVEEKIVEVLMAEAGPCFILSSSQNIDRIVSAYRAAIRADRIFVVDIYTAWILRELSGFTDHTPTINWSGIRVLSKGRTAGRHYQRVKENPDIFEDFVFSLYKEGNVITHNEIACEPGKYFIKNSYVNELMKIIGCDQAGLIYSMWRGLMEEEHNSRGYKNLLALKEDTRINYNYVHSGGHAGIVDLKRFADAIEPKMIVPIHTEHKDRYAEYFDQKVKLLEDGELLTL